MRFTRTLILAGAGALLAAGTAAVAADKLHTMKVALPDGSVAQIEYAGEVAPKVSLVPVDAVPVALVDPFAEFDRIAAQFDAQQQAMMQQVAAMQQAADHAASGAPGQVTVAGLPAGAHYTFVSSTTDSKGCTQTVEYSSDGASQQPKVTRTSAGSCDKAASDAPVAASAVAPTAPPAPGTKV